MGTDVERKSGGSLRPFHGVTAVVVAVVGVLVAFWALHTLAGLIWFVIKLGVVVGLVAGVLWLMVSRRR
jgi:hypothetical protein